MGCYPIVLDLPEGRIEAQVELPAGPVRLVEFAYRLLGLGSAVAEMGERRIQELGGDTVGGWQFATLALGWSTP